MGAESINQYPELVTNGAVTGKKMKLIWICADDRDFAPNGAKTTDKTLTKHGGKYSFSTTLPQLFN